MTVKFTLSLDIFEQYFDYFAILGMFKLFMQQTLSRIIMKRLPLAPSLMQANIEFNVGTIFWCMEDI